MKVIEFSTTYKGWESGPSGFLKSLKLIDLGQR